MTETTVQIYTELIQSIRDFLTFKLEVLDFEASGKKKTSQGSSDAYYISKIYAEGSILFTQPPSEEAALIGINGLLSDILETLYQGVLKEREVRTSGTSEDINRFIPTYMASCRKQLRALNHVTSVLRDPTAAPNDYLPDDRLEMLLTALKQTTQFHQIVEKEYQFNKFVFFLGYVLFGLQVSSLFAVVLLKFIDASTDFFSFLSRAGALSITIEPTAFVGSPVYQALRICHGVLLVLLLAYSVTLKIHLGILSKKSKSGNISARFVYAHYHLSMFGISLLTHTKSFVYEIIECAESGYPPALYRLGLMYELGYSTIIKPDKRLALQYYSRASRHIQAARDRYNILSRSLH